MRVRPGTAIFPITPSHAQGMENDVKSFVLGFTAISMMTATAVTAQSLDWRYTDGTAPEHWAKANASYAACDAGKMQSPIDLNQANAIGDIELSTNYGPAKAKLSLGQHKVQIDAAEGQGMVSGDRQFNLIQVHFHTPSEHAIDGKRYPLVAHFVHATDDGTLGVLGVMFEEGEANPGLQAIIDALPQGNKASFDIDLAEMVPEELQVYRYMGSLTTPPCSENVNWHVVEEVLEASPAQIAVMEQALGMSARSIQPANNRLIVAPAD